MKKILPFVILLGLCACKQDQSNQAKAISQTNPTQDAMLVLPTDPCGRHVILNDDGKYYTVNPDGKWSPGVLVGTFTKSECQDLVKNDNLSKTIPLAKVVK